MPEEVTEEELKQIEDYLTYLELRRRQITRLCRVVVDKLRVPPEGKTEATKKCTEIGYDKYIKPFYYWLEDKKVMEIAREYNVSIEVAREIYRMKLRDEARRTVAPPPPVPTEVVITAEERATIMKYVPKVPDIRRCVSLDLLRRPDIEALITGIQRGEERGYTWEEISDFMMRRLKTTPAWICT